MLSRLRFGDWPSSGEGDLTRNRTTSAEWNDILHLVLPTFHIQDSHATTDCCMMLKLARMAAARWLLLACWINAWHLAHQTTCICKNKSEADF